MLLVILGIFPSIYFSNSVYEETEDSLSHVQKAAPLVLLPTNTMNDRQSAHFVEINAKYFELMSKAFLEKAEKIKEERMAMSFKDRVTKYAHPSYNYQPAKVEDN